MFHDSSAHEPEAADRARVAVVDDEVDLRGSIADYLSSQGVTVLEAGDAAALDRLLQEHEVDLVLLDVNMPGEDGFSIARRLRASSDVGLIMLTARTDTVDRVLGLEVGADDYLAKPFALMELHARVRAVLRRRRREQPAALRVAESAPNHSASWDLRLLGRFQLIGRDGEAPLHARKAIALLTYLALQPGQWARRDALAGLLWEDFPAAQARASLRQALASIRKLENDNGPILALDADVVRLSTDVTVDALMLDRVEVSGWPQQDELLPGLDFPNLPTFGAWLSIERARVRQKVTKALAHRIELALRPGGDLESVSEAAFRLLALDPMNEVAHRALMIVHSRQGRGALALRQFRHLSKLLADELQVAPEAETLDLYDRIKAGRYRPVTPIVEPNSAPQHCDLSA